MQNGMQENAFTRFYLWMTAAKITMGLFFVYFVFMYLLLGLISSGPVVELDFLTAVEMVFAAFFLGIMQQVLLPGGDRLTKVRCSLWVLSGVVITLGFSLVFGWFAAFPLWCPIVFIALTGIGVAAMIYRYQLQLNRETRKLNKRLEQFQKMKK